MWSPREDWLFRNKKKRNQQSFLEKTFRNQWFHEAVAREVFLHRDNVPFTPLCHSLLIYIRPSMFFLPGVRPSRVKRDGSRWEWEDEASKTGFRVMSLIILFCFGELLFFTIICSRIEWKGRRQVREFCWGLKEMSSHPVNEKKQSEATQQSRRTFITLPLWSVKGLQLEAFDAEVAHSELFALKFYYFPVAIWILMSLVASIDRLITICVQKTIVRHPVLYTFS